MSLAKEYRKKAKEYRDLIVFLKNRIALIDFKLKEVTENLYSQHAKYILYPESAEGLIILMFDQKEESVWKTQYETILENMNQGRVNLEMKITSAEQLAIYWEQRAQIEEAK